MVTKKKIVMFKFILFLHSSPALYYVVLYMQNPTFNYRYKIYSM